MRILPTLLTFFLLGMVTQVGQVLLGRELLATFYGNEAILGIFFGAWLFWIGAGGTLYAFLSRRMKGGELLFPALAAAIPAALLAEVFLVRHARSLLDVSPAEVMSLGTAGATILLLTTPLSGLVGFSFPLGCRVLAGGAREASLGYALEAAGSLAGGVLTSYLLAGVLHPVQTALGALALLWLNAAVTGIARRSLPLALPGGLLAVAAALLLLSPAGAWLSSAAARIRWNSIAPHLELLQSAETPYQHAAIGKLNSSYSLLLDGKYASTFPDPQGASGEVALAAAMRPGARSLLLVGGAASDLVAEWARYPLERIDCIEQDPDSFRLARPYLPEEARRALDDDRVHILFQDGRRHVNEISRDPRGPRYDLVILALPDPATAALNRYYTREFFQGVRMILNPRGVVGCSLGSTANYLGPELKSYVGSVRETLRSVFSQVEVIPGEPNHLFAAREAGVLSVDPVELKRRFLSIPLDRRTFPPDGFGTLVEPERVEFLRSHLDEEKAEVNCDLRPITHYLNLLYWGKMSGSPVVAFIERLRSANLWALFTPLLVLLFFRLAYAMFYPDRLREVRFNALGGTAALGFAAMALEMLLLLAYQSLLGSLYRQLGLLNGTFMFALVAGALAGRALLRPLEGRRAALCFVFAGLLLAGAGFALALPSLLDWAESWLAGTEEVVLALVFTGGLLTGAGFPLAVAIYRSSGEDTSRSVGWLEAADHLGGAMGGLIAGSFLAPLLGFRSTAMAIAAVLCAGAVLGFRSGLLERRAAEEPPLLPRPRGRLAPSFPWVRASWVLAALTAGVFAAAAVLREGPRHTLHFEDRDLQAVSGSEIFELRDSPFPHYLGRGISRDLDPGSAGPESSSQATIPLAGEIRGYGGPMNLLVSISRQGTILGVRLVESSETPSYIEGIDEWLEKLRGRDIHRRLELGEEGIDAITGATVTSDAVVRILDRVSVRVGEEALGLSFPPDRRPREPSLLDRLGTPKAGLALLMLLLFFPVYLHGGRRIRLAFLVLSAALLGLLLNALVNLVDLGAASLGQFPPASNAAWWVVAGGALLISILFGQAFCGYLCPFGAAQEIVSTLGERLGLRQSPSAGFERAARYFKYIVLAVALTCFWITGDRAFVLWSPMDTFFAFKLEGAALALAIVAFTAALFYFRFWCRYLCPVGAFLALFNKIAVLWRLAPARSFPRCDLGAQGPFHLDCLKCNRCARQGPQPAPRLPRPDFATGNVEKPPDSE